MGQYGHGPRTASLPQLPGIGILRAPDESRTNIRSSLLSYPHHPVITTSHHDLFAFTGISTQDFARRKTRLMAHEVPPLPYDYNALEPHIDEQTMHLHHDKHHAAYVTNLNNALQSHPDLQNKKVDDLLRDLNSVPEAIRTAVRNHGGGHANHTMFWAIMKPNGGGPPTGAIADAINSAFGSFDNLKTKFNEAGAKLFGSGWVWVVNKSGSGIELMTTPNQDSPMLQGADPIFGNDVWEHAYYLKYQNRRPDYLNAWWNVVNWDEINKRLNSAGTKRG
jgi:Fe-Mn family superoxide dismutase